MIKKKLRLLLIVGLFTLIGCGSFDKIQCDLEDNNVENRLEALNGTYTLLPPDIIEISVSDNPDLRTRAIIRPDGNIFFPLLGDVYVEGLTPLEVREKMHTLLSRYLKELPEESVSVMVVGFNSKKVYVHSFEGIREVPFTGNLTVLDAITQAGLLSRSVKQRSITVVRGESDTVEKPQRLVVNLKKITNKGKTEKNMVLRPNDVIYLPPTILARVGYAVKALLNPVQPVRQIGQSAASYQYNQLGFGGPQRGGGFGGGGGGGSIGNVR